MFLEILDKNDRVLSARRLGGGLTLIGRSPGAHVHLGGAEVGPLHVAIRGGKQPLVMDLGGPVPLRIDGREVLEHPLTRSGQTDKVLIEIGSHRLRLAYGRGRIPELRTQEWRPLADSKSKRFTLRARFFLRGRPHDVCNSRGELILPQGLGVDSSFRLAWLSGKTAQVQLPAEWLGLKGGIKGAGNDYSLNAWAQPVALEADVIYKVIAGAYAVELLFSSRDGVVVPRAALDFLPRELRKPLATSLAVVAAIVALWALWLAIFGPKETKVEEPYNVYARTQSVPVEKIEEPEPTAPSQQPLAGGGAGSETAQSTAPTVGQAAATPSKIAASLTGGLKNLFGNVISKSKASNAVVAETGVGVAAAAGAPGPSVGKLAAVGQGTSGIAGAAKLGALSIAGSGKGFSGGSGVGLGAGAGAGIGNGVGKGIGRGSFRVVEEESIVDGGLDKSVIAAVIQNNLAQIKYCYERQLIAEPDLFGKVVANWVINAAGTVEATTVKQTTLNSAPVERCILGKISGWKFPQPKNGTKVTVSYPFLFKSTN